MKELYRSLPKEVPATKEIGRGLRALLFIAHPDDEAFMGGTITKLVERGVDVTIVSVTDGGAGSSTISREALVSIRRQEAQRAGAVLGVKDYRVLNFRDGEFYEHPHAIDMLAREIRKVRPNIVFTHTKHDYHGDHRNLQETVRRALERAKMAEYKTDEPPTEELVALYAMDPQGLKTNRSQIAPAHIVVRVGEAEMHKRLQSFAEHASQLIEKPAEGEFGYVERSRREGIVRGVQAGFPYGEGFQQLYGDYPLTQRNVLLEILGKDDVFVVGA